MPSEIETIETREVAQPRYPDPQQEMTIWTPRFIILFGLILTIGLSVGSILTMEWLVHAIRGEWILLGYTLLLAGGWLGVIFFARSRWLQSGGLFGCLWAIFMCLSQVVSIRRLDPTSPILGELNAVTLAAFLGAYTCCSVYKSPYRRWDSWFFSLSLIVGISIVLLIYLLTPAIERAVIQLENTVAVLGLVLSLLVWWLRPSCWKSQPGTTLLIGLTPAILLVLTIPGLASPDSNLLLTQAAWLSLLLGQLHIIQAERIGL